MHDDTMHDANYNIVARVALSVLAMIVLHTRR